MAEDIERRARQLREKGYSIPQIRRTLLREGYRKGVIETVLSSMDTDDSDLSNVSRFMTALKYLPVATVPLLLVAFLAPDGLKLPIVLVLGGVTGFLELIAVMYYAMDKDYREFAIYLGSLIAVVAVAVAVTSIDTGGPAATVPEQPDRPSDTGIAAACADIAETIDDEYCTMYVATSGGEIDCGEYQIAADDTHDVTANAAGCDWRYDPYLKTGVSQEGRPVVVVEGEEYDCNEEGFFDLHCPVIE